MEEEQIIKALECCNDGTCEYCPFGGKECYSEVRKEAIDLINRKNAEIKREHEIVEAYAQAARTIELYLHEFCDKKLPYDEMIADASRKASEEIARLKANEEMAEGYADALIERTEIEAIKEFAKFLVDNEIDVVDLTVEFLRKGESDA